MPSATKYRTIDLARACGIHVNTVRFYERIGLISPVPRAANNYRLYSERHLVQIQVLRLLYQGEWPGKVVRRAAHRIVTALKAWDLPQARAAHQDYLTTIQRELDNARKAAELLRMWDARAATSAEEYPMARVVSVLGVTTETIRNWERNGLINIPRRGPHRKRYLTTRELNQCRVVALLLKCGFSLSAIHESLRHLAAEGADEAVRSLRQPATLEIVSAGDHYLEVLEQVQTSANALTGVLDQIDSAL